MYAIFINLCTVSSNVHVELYLFPWPTLTVIMAGPNCPTNWQSTSRNVTLVQILNHLSALEFLNFDIDTVWMSTQYLEKVPNNAAQPIVCQYFWVLLLAPHQNFTFVQRLICVCIVQCSARLSADIKQF